MDKDLIIQLQKTFEDYAKKADGIEFWLARDLQNILGYVEWRKFSGVLERAKDACKNSGYNVSDHFVDVAKKVSLGSGAERSIEDIMLTRYAC